jgi:hypothetical protein
MQIPESDRPRPPATGAACKIRTEPLAHLLQSAPFPAIEEEIGEAALNCNGCCPSLRLVPLAKYLAPSGRYVGRPQHDRQGISHRVYCRDGCLWDVVENALDELFACQKDSRRSR